MGRSLAPWLVTSLLLAAGATSLPAASPAVAQPAPARIELPAGHGTRLVVEPSPFRLRLVDRAGADIVATVPGASGPPVRVPGIDGPMPAEPLGPAGGFPAIGWVVGTDPGVTFPATFWTGNRLFGAEAGALVSVTEVADVQRGGGATVVSLATDAPSVGHATLTVRRLPAGGVRLDVAPPEGLPASAMVTTLESPPSEGLFGLGARKDRFDQRGLLRNVWVEQQNAGAGPFNPIADPTFGEDYTFPNGAQAAYYVHATLFGSRGWGLWHGSSALSRLDLAASRPDAIRWGVAEPQVSFFLAGGGLESASQAFTALAGRAPAPPRFVYEPWIDVINEGEGSAAPYGGGFSGGERVKRDVLDVAETAEQLDIPIGVIGIEGWHAVPGMEELARELRARGFHLSAYWSPFLAPDTEAYATAERNGWLIETPTGDPYPIVENRGSTVYLPDFTHPEARAWWGHLVQRSEDVGFDAYMHDFGEQVTEGMRFHSGEGPDLVHNAYPVLYHLAAAGGPGDAWFYVRAGYSNLGADAGTSAATSGVFPGDETTDWDEGSGLPSVIPAMLNLAFTGSYTFTTDVGGYLDLYTPQTSKELLIRWSQLAAFTAVSRIHSSTFNGSVYPWDIDDETVDIYRRYARAKVALMDLVDHWSRRAATDGTIGPVRPIVLEDASAEARGLDDEWLLGRDILVAPIIEEGAREREVYLPRGARWERVTVGDDGRLLPTGDVADGGTTVVAPAPLADIPIFVRVGGTEAPLADTGGAGPVGREQLPATGGGLVALSLLGFCAAAGASRRS